MNNIKQALESAIEFIEGTASFIPVDYDHIGIDAVKQCKVALAELGKREPVGWIYGTTLATNHNYNYVYLGEIVIPHPEWKPLYTSPPQQQWVGLSDHKIDKMWEFYRGGWYDFARAIEAKLKDLNT